MTPQTNGREAGAGPMLQDVRDFKDPRSGSWSGRTDQGGQPRPVRRGASGELMRDLRAGRRRPGAQRQIQQKYAKRSRKHRTQLEPGAALLSRLDSVGETAGHPWRWSTGPWRHAEVLPPFRPTLGDPHRLRQHGLRSKDGRRDAPFRKLNDEGSPPGTWTTRQPDRSRKARLANRHIHRGVSTLPMTLFDAG